MAENTTDETVDYNSEDNSQGPTNPKDRRTGYSSVSELLRANYFNTLKKGATSVKPLFEAAKAGVLPVQKEQAKAAQKVKPAFSLKDAEAAAMAENKPKSEAVSKPANIITKPQIFTEKPVKPTLIRKEKQVPTLEEFQQQTAKDIYKFRSESEPIVKIPSQPEKDNSDVEIAVENTMRLFNSQLNKDAPNRDFTISNVKNNIYNGLNNGDLRIVNDKDGYPVVKNVIDGVLSNVIEGYRQTAIQDKEHDTYFSLSKEQQIARLKGYNLKPIETVGEVGKLYPEKYRQTPLDPYQGAIETQRTGFAPEVAAGIGQVGYDVRYSAARAIPVAGNALSEIMSSVSYGKRQLMDGIAKSFNTAVQSGLSDDEAWEIANSPYNKILNAVTGAAEGYTSQAVNKNIFKSFAKPASTKALRTFGQAMSTFVKDAAANSKEAIGSAAIDAATAWSMEKLRGGSDEAANEQGKMEFLVNMALVGLGAGFKAPKYIKSYAYNAISNVDPQDIYTKGVQLEQQGFMPEGTSKRIVENVEKFKKIKEGLVNVKEENIPSVAGLLMKKDSLLEMQKTADSSNTALQDSINNELNIVNEKITTAINAKNPLSVEYDDKTGINLKYNENAITANEQKQQESATASNISEYQRTEGIQTQTPYEANSGYSDFGSKKEKIKFPGTVYLDASNASNYSITEVSTPRDFMINSANKVISSLSTINPGLKVIVFDNATEYGTALVERELGPGTVNNQRAAELRGSNGAYDKSNNTIYINGEQLNKNGKTTTLFHEGTHPIINAIASSSSVAVDNLYEQLNQLSATMADMQKTGEMPNGLEISDAIDEVVNWADRVYKSQSDATKKSEAIVEFIARVSDGTITLPQDSPVVMKSFIDVIKGFLDIIGMPVDIRNFSDIENIAAKIKEAFETGQRIEVSTVKNENGEITLYNDNIKVGEPGTVSASGVINPEMFNVDNLQTDLFQPAKISWNEFESDGSFDMITPENAVRMYDALKKSGGALVVTNSDATGIGLSNKGNLRQGGIGFTFIQENLDTEIGFAASDDSKIPSFYKAVVDAKNKRDAAYPSEAGKPVAVFVMVQSPTAMFGNAYGADYFADSLEYVTRNKAISTRKAKAELVDFISNFVKANETGRKYESSFAELVDIIKRYDMSTDEGKNAIDQLLITNKESNRDTSNRFGFDARRYFFSNFFAGEGTVSSKAPASNLRNALKESGFYIKDFIDEYGDENVVNNLSGKNNTEKYMKDGGFAMTGFFVDPYMSQEEFVAKSKNQTFQHRQFNSGFHGVDPFILDGKYYVNEAFPEASFVSNKPGSEGKEIPVATSAAGSMYPRTQKNQQQVVERFASQIDNGIKAEKSSGTTQVATTTGSYVKAAKIAQSLGAKSILDYGAGLGLGSDAMSNIINNVDSFEPNVDRWKGKKEPSFTSSADINKTYDAVVSLNVLNVVPKDIRDAIVKDIYNKLNDGGSAIISTRGWSNDINQAKNAEKGPEPKSAIIKRKEAGGVTDVYQKGFDGNELVDYVKDLLGDNVTVKKDNSFGKAGVVITKQPGALQLQQEGGTRKSFKKTQAEANRSQQDVEASFVYDSKKKERAQKVLKDKVKGSNLDRVSRSLIDNQALTRKSLRDAGERGAIVEALLTTSRGYGAQASLVADDVNSVVYDGLSSKEDINIAGVMFSEVSLLDEIMNQKRMISIQDMLKDNFDKLLKLKEQFDKTKSAKKKARIQDEITFVEDYLKDRNVLGTKYNPKTKKSEYYLQNYQVGSTVDANGKTIPNNAEMAKKKLAIIEQSYNKKTTKYIGDTQAAEKSLNLWERADKMFDTYRAILGDKLENGLIDQETYDILSKYDYVPISYIEHILNDEVPGYSKVTPKNPNQMTKSVLSGGADGDVLTDFKAVLDIYLNNHYKNVFNNRAAVGLAKMAETMPNNGIVELVQSVKDNEGNEILNPDGNPKYPSAPEGKGYIYYYDNGKRRALLTDLAIANEWYATYDAGGFDVLGKATLAPFTQSLLTGKNAAFGIYQMMLLDPITVAVSTDVFSKSVPIAYAQIASGWKNAVVQVAKAGSDYRRAALAGAFTQMNIGKELESSLKYEGKLGRIGTKASEFVDKIGLGKVTDITEKATRLIVYLRAEEVFTKQFVKENGQEPSAADMEDIRAKAAHEARRSADFARGGSFVKPLSKSFLYLNSTAQTGAAVLAQIRKNPARFAYQTSEFLVAGGAIQAISAGLVPLPWEDEEERKKKQEMYKALSDYTKLNYFNIYVGGDDPESAFVKIPLPPVIKNIWATGMMGMINAKMNGNFKANDFVLNGLAVNPFGDVESLISKAPPVVNALLAFSNYDLFKKDLIVDNEEAMPDYLEAYKDKNVPGLAKSTTKWLDKYGINLSPKRGYEAVNKIIGDPSRNPMLNIPKVAFNSTLQFMTGAPIQVKTDFEKDWLKTTLEVAGLQKRLYSASYKYYESRTISEIAEIKNMKENLLIEQVAKGENSKEYKALNEKIATAESKLGAFINKVKTEDKDSYSKLVEVNKKNQTVVSKSMMKKGELEYIKNVFGADYLELAKIPRTAEKAQRIYDMAERMDEQKAYEFLTNVVKLKIMTPEVARSYGEIGKQEE